ncbi:hypothetical protein LUZ61_004236 [Rhynchospora tenuis]|uniref:poly(ADP-ribose) glycohydrolase n=1 Tax=Rhynchospora tenuis TaxID=198213 RepID=A0AAD5ZM90_9POAL|nr:hypothetical protein LUZ61_004236 [Rhynchospora tenuis]
MEERAHVKSILPFLPLELRGSSLAWPEAAGDSLKSLSLGPTVSGIDCGNQLFGFIVALRDSLGFSSSQPPLSPHASDGFSLFFDQLMSREDAKVWFGDTLPTLGGIVLNFPSLLETHYDKSSKIFGEKGNGLRIMEKQHSGIVLLSQELIAALLTCSLLCLFPTDLRYSYNLRNINFDQLFAGLSFKPRPSQEHKVKCLVHYFQRICNQAPTGYVSFERKVLPLQPSCGNIYYPVPDVWKNSTVPLCTFKVFYSGLMEDEQDEVLEVDFANRYLGGGALKQGAVQEEIRFMINPELIAGMLFMPSMEKNEAIEVIGSERFSYHKGYASTFKFAGDYRDKKLFDSMGRRNTRIVAIDALSRIGVAQYEVENILREANKAFCGFMDHSKFQHYLPHFQGNTDATGSSSLNLVEKKFKLEKINEESSAENRIGIATGNWGCGAFGGDPQIKSMIQWLAASQALRPFFHYYTFENPALQGLDQVMQGMVEKRWTVGQLWQNLSDYSCEKLNGNKKLSFFKFVTPAVRMLH